MSVLQPYDIFSAIEATWPPVRRFEHEGWVFRDGGGGGPRVCQISRNACHIITQLRAERGKRICGDINQNEVRPLPRKHARDGCTEPLGRAGDQYRFAGQVGH